MTYNPLIFEKKWQNHWIDHGIFVAETFNSKKKKFYVLDMFPYPSGEGLHVGHPLGYIASDVVAKYKKMLGYNVLHPMGYDAFGLPAEQYAIQTGRHPADTTKKNIARYKEQLIKLGLGYDWHRKVCTSEPEYYKWTQKIFTLLFNSWYDFNLQKARPITELLTIFEHEGNINVKKNQKSVENSFTKEEWNKFFSKEKEEILQNYRLAYRSESLVNWCPELGTVLSNDEVKDGRSERGGYPVIEKKMMQWMLRVSAYAERLLKGIEELEWSKSIKEIQKNWIGKSEGANIVFNIKNLTEKIIAFTTRPETIFGVTYIVVSTNHHIVKAILDEKLLKTLDELKKNSQSKNSKQEMQGFFTGFYAEHPFTREKIPIWVGNYVLEGYGTEAVMAVPSDDDRDKKFAEKYSLPIKKILENNVLVNSDFLNEKNIPEAREEVIFHLEKNKLGERNITYKIRDAIFGRQRYWGEPIPIFYSQDNVPEVLPENELPLLLPDVKSYKPSADGRSPLANIDNWQYNGRPLETDTMPGWAASSWYFFKYMNSNRDDFIQKDDQKYWKNVDLYVGGSEHTTGHLIYSRFFTKFLYDIGYVSTNEPFKRLVNQGMILGKSAWIFRIKDTNKLISADVKDHYDTIPIRVPVDLIEDNFVFTEKLRKWRQDFHDVEFIKNDNDDFLCTREVEKMSKSKYNTIIPDAIIEKYGADTLRLYTLFLGPLEDTKPWDTHGISGVYKFLHKVWGLFFKNDGTPIFEKKKPKEKEQKILHETIKKISYAIETLSLNTAVSSFMMCVNELIKMKCANYEILKDFLRLLAPFAPHICEEIWQHMGENDSIFNSYFPKFDEKILKLEEIEYPVSINGKKKLSIHVNSNLSEEDIKKIILQNELIMKYITTLPKKIIIVKNKIINIVL